MAAVKPLSPEALYRRCDPGMFAFDTTDDLKALDRIIGQDRAVEAVRFGIGIRREGYNMFALGPSGTGKYNMVRQFLEDKAATDPVPLDLCYINNFETSHKPDLLLLPTGRGAPLRRDMERLVEELQAAIPAAFESDEYRNRKQALEEQFKERHEKAFAAIQGEAQEKGIALMRTPVGLALAPVHDGEVLSPEDFKKLSKEDQDRTKEDMTRLEGKLHDALVEAPKWEGELREKVKGLNRDVANFAMGHLIGGLRKGYQDLPEVLSYFDAVQNDLIENLDQFLAPEAGTSEAANAMAMPQTQSPRSFLRRYQVNLMVDHGKSQGAPVVYEDHPNLQNLIGSIEHISQFGAMMTDFTLIKPGALHRANGGYLILDARKILTTPYAWEELKRSLMSHEIRIESLAKILSMVSSVSLEPEPVALDVKVVLIGDRMLYYMLCQHDPDFSELFKVAVDFEEELDRRPAHMKLYARLIADVIRREKLKPFDRSAVARVIEHASRMAGDSEKISTHMRSLADLLREADYWTSDNGKTAVSADDVQKAIDAKIRRVDRMRERSHEQITRKTIFIDTKGAVTGQVNALSVLQLGDFSFGRPSRITARVRLGKGEVVDIEREVELSGPLHSKGVLILSGFLGARYCRDLPLSLSASLVFEQSYGGIDGDSASSTELYVLISALAEAPIKQSMAVTGSVNQLGQVQPIGGVNEKIEGFFDICKADGLSGEQGVMIPASNVKHLMVRRDVIDAVARGQFHIWPVATIDEGIEILTGIPAGARGKDGKFPADSINGRVEAALIGFAEKARAFAQRHHQNGGDD